MVSTLKERPNGGFYCSECRMSTSDPVAYCPYCGSIISNYEEVMRANINIDPPDPETLYPEEPMFINNHELKETLKRMKVNINEDNNDGRN